MSSGISRQQKISSDADEPNSEQKISHTVQANPPANILRPSPDRDLIISLKLTTLTLCFLFESLSAFSCCHYNVAKRTCFDNRNLQIRVFKWCSLKTVQSPTMINRVSQKTGKTERDREIDKKSISSKPISLKRRNRFGF